MDVLTVFTWWIHGRMVQAGNLSRPSIPLNTSDYIAAAKKAGHHMRMVICCCASILLLFG